MAKELQLKPITLEVKKGVKATYKELIIECLDTPSGETGFTFKDLKERDRIEKVLKDSKELLVLEDNDATNLQQIVEEMRWGKRHSDLLAFKEDVENMPDHTPETSN